MRIITNTKFIKRNQAIGKYLTIGSVVILLIGMVVTFMPQYFNWSLVAIVVGFTASQFAIHYNNQYNRIPRLDELVTNALKGLNDQYTLYHYITPVSHLLVGPAGVLPILPYRQKGEITYNESRQRWQQKGGNVYLKLMAQEGLGRPDMDTKVAKTDIDRFLDMLDKDGTIPDAQPILVFMHPEVKVDAKNSPYPTIVSDKLKDLVRRLAREKPLNQKVVEHIQASLPGGPEE